MIVLRVWLRRSLGILIAPLVAGALTFGAWSRDGWQYESLWGLRAVVLLMPLISPVIAGAVAFDVARRWGPVVTVLGPSTARWRRTTLALAAVHVAWAFLGVCLVWAAVGVRLVMNRAMWQLDPWLPLEVLAAMGAGAAVGLVVGSRARSLAAPPLAAVLVFGVEALAGPYGFMSLFSPMAVVDSVVGLERNPAAAAWAIALNLTVLVCCSLVALRGPARSTTWIVEVTLAYLALGGVLVGQAHFAPLDFRASAQPQVCARSSDTEVCGPGHARPFLVDLADALASAMQALAGSGLPLPHRFVLGVPGEQAAPTSAVTVVLASPIGLAKQRRQATIARVLAQPQACPQLSEPDADTTALLDRQEQVSSWLRGALSRGPARAPHSVLEAYRELTTCRPTP